jgi:hypothetical protein
MTFSGFREHTSPIFKALNLLKFLDLVHVNTASFMFQYGSGNLLADFCGFFTLIKNNHDYTNRLAFTNAYAIHAPVRTNYGIFNIIFCGLKVWSSVDESLKSLCLKTFKRKLKEHILVSY